MTIDEKLNKLADQLEAAIETPGYVRLVVIIRKIWRDVTK